MNVKILLEKLREFEAKAETMRLDHQVAIDAVLPAEVKAEMDDINYRYRFASEALSEEIAELENQIKVAVLAGGESVKVGSYAAVYVKGRTGWDTKALDGYAAAHPEIGQFKKVGVPSVSIRRG